MLRKGIHIIILVFAGMFFSAITANAEDDCEHLNVVLQQLNISHDDCAIGFVSERVLPHSPHLSVMVVPEITEIIQDDQYAFEAKEHIVLINNRSGKIKSYYVESEKWVSDGIQIESVYIDSVFYQLNKKNIAFGIIIRYVNMSRAAPYAEEQLSLYIPQGKKMNKILREHSKYYFTGLWNTYCAGEFETRENNIEVSKKQTNGFNDLIINTKVTSSTTWLREEDEECVSEDEVSTEQTTLMYSNGKYRAY